MAHLPRKISTASPTPDDANSDKLQDNHILSAYGDMVNRSLHAAIARMTGGISPAAVCEAYLDWASHLAFNPGKTLQLLDKALRRSVRFSQYMRQCGLLGPHSENCVHPLPNDKRFADEAWQHWPFNLMSQSFLLQQKWWHNATTGIRGVTQQHENVVEFMTRQILDMVSPSNFLLTNPVLLAKTRETMGMNLARGFHNFVDDWERTASGKKPIGTEIYRVGKDVAVTNGKVVYSNALIELIHYEPTTEKVFAEPLLIVPAWIMKYYILDLSPHNSLVKYLVDQGYRVFMISWKNPGPDQRDWGMDFYRENGIMKALECINALYPQQKIHAAGYCLGGTLLSITAAAMARENDDRLKSITLFAAQTDFVEAGELTLFINESQLSFLEDMMWEQGFLDSTQMAGAFQLLRSNDLMWSRMINDYLMGERAKISDLMAWNADATRMPYRMHSEYLRELFLNNDLAEGRYRVNDRPVALSDIRVPIFAVGTVLDHVAPWRSVFKIHLLSDTEVTFLLTSGGHNAGIVSEPGHINRHYQIKTKKTSDAYTDPDAWIKTASQHNGSWWPEWAEWLRRQQSRHQVNAQQTSRILGAKEFCPAPGRYVLEM